MGYSSTTKILLDKDSTGTLVDKFSSKTTEIQDDVFVHYENYFMMVRPTTEGVDLGLWTHLSPASLLMPVSLP